MGILRKGVQGHLTSSNMSSSFPNHRVLERQGNCSQPFHVHRPVSLHPLSEHHNLMRFSVKNLSQTHPTGSWHKRVLSGLEYLWTLHPWGGLAACSPHFSATQAAETKVGDKMLGFHPPLPHAGLDDCSLGKT